MATLPSWPVIESGNTGFNVRALQCLLNFRNKNTALAVDGVFGTLTKNAVIAYQKNNGLNQDGRAGNTTLSKLIAGVLVRNFTVNMAARAAQCLLNKFGENIVIDGVFGSKSAAAAKNFQKKMGITSDGVINPVSWQFLFGYNAYPKPSGETGTAYATVCAGTSTLTTEQKEANAQYIYNYLIKNGFTKQAACGVLGNLQRTSALNPGIWQGSDNIKYGYGLAQWTPATRFLNWLAGIKVISAATAAAVNALTISNPKSLMDNQLTFFIADCNNTVDGKQFFVPTGTMQHSGHSMTFAQYKASTLSADILAIVIHDHYFRSKDTLEKINYYSVAYANYWFSKFKNL